MLDVLGGVLIALGFVWLVVEWLLRYAAKHDVRIVSWAGRWPQNAQPQRDINDRLDRAQDRELRRLRQVRPIPIALLVAGVVLIMAGSA